MSPSSAPGFPGSRPHTSCASGNARWSSSSANSGRAASSSPNASASSSSMRGPTRCWCRSLPLLRLCNELGLGDRLFPTKLPRTAFVCATASSMRFQPRRSSDFRRASNRCSRARCSGCRPSSGWRRSSSSHARRRQTTSRSQDSCGAGSGPRPSPTSPNRCSPASTPATSSGFRCARCFRGLSKPRPEPAASSRRFGREHGPAQLPTECSVRFQTASAELIDGLMKAVPKESVRFGSNVTRIEEADGFTIHVADKPPIRARAVILAIPAFAAAELLRPIDADLSAACESIRYLSTATVVFAFPREAVRHDLQGHWLRGAAGRRHQHHRRRVDLVEVASARTGRTGAVARVSRWRARSGRAVENRCRAGQRRARRSHEDSRHPRHADHDARVSVESIEPAAGSRARRPDEAHRREARGASRALRLGRRIPRRRAFPTASPMRATQRARAAAFVR